MTKKKKNWKGLSFTLKEGKKELETFENNKSPGEDGFTAQFFKDYKQLFDIVGTDLIKVAHSCLFTHAKINFTTAKSISHSRQNHFFNNCY